MLAQEPALVVPDGVHLGVVASEPRSRLFVVGGGRARRDELWDASVEGELLEAHREMRRVANLEAVRRVRSSAL